MEIKTAKDPTQSDTLIEAKRSERLALGLLIGSVSATVIWFAVPENIKAKMTPFLSVAGLGVATAFQKGLIKIKNGRMAVGDLPEVIKNYALLPAGEAKLLNTVKPFVEGNLKLQELPEVRSLIEAAVSEATKPKEVSMPPQIDMHEKVRQLQQMQRDPADFDSIKIRQADIAIGEGVALPPIEIKAEHELGEKNIDYRSVI